MRRILLATLIAGLFIFEARAGERFRRYEKKVPNQYIVVLAERNRARIEDLAKTLPRQFGGRVLGVFTHVLGGFAIELTEAQAIALSGSPAVSAVHEDAIGELLGAGSGPAFSWGQDRIDQRSLPLNGTYTYAYSGATVRAYVIDTGIKVTGDLAGRVVARFDCRTGTCVTDTTGATTTSADCLSGNGHGTSVASTLGGSTYGIAKDVEIVSMKATCGSSGSVGLIAALDWIAARNVVIPSEKAVANVSLLFAANDTIDQAVLDAVGAGVTIVVGAGNAGENACGSSPQRTGNPAFVNVPNPNGYSAITVAASDRNDHISLWAQGFESNTGPCVDIFAPGGPGLTAQGEDTVETTWDGTSAAAPHAAGIAAQILERYGDVTPGMVETHMLQNATTGVITVNPDPAAQATLANTPNKLVHVVGAKRRACCG